MQKHAQEQRERERKREEKADALFASLVKLVDADKLAAFAKKVSTIDQQFGGDGSTTLIEAVRNRLLPGVSKHEEHEWLAAAAMLPVVLNSPNAERLLSTVGRPNEIKEHLCQRLDDPLQRLANVGGTPPQNSNSAKGGEDLGRVTGRLSDRTWWCPRSFIDPVVIQHGETLQQEVEGANLAHHQAPAREVMLADNRIYSEIHDKKKKNPKYAELAALSKESAARFNKKSRPSQPVEDGGDILMVSQAKGHAAAANTPHRAVIDDVAHVNGLEEDAKPIPSMKHTFRIAQKVLNPPKKQPPPNPSPPCQPCSVNRMHPNL